CAKELNFWTGYLFDSW
nr:immunoglobulin heavy chain junction region [Macaca mulatta]